MIARDSAFLAALAAASFIAPAPPPIPGINDNPRLITSPKPFAPNDKS